MVDHLRKQASKLLSHPNPPLFQSFKLEEEINLKNIFLFLLLVKNYQKWSKKELFLLFMSFEKLDLVEMNIYLGKIRSNVFENDFYEIKIR